MYYAKARFYDPATSRWLSPDPHWNAYNRIYGDNPKDPLGLGLYVPDINAIRQSGNLYAYCMNNPLMYHDPSGFAAVFHQRKDGNWSFLYDSKSQNVAVSLFGFVPFLDNAIWWGATKLAGNKALTTHLAQDIATTLGASLGAASFAAGASKFAAVAGRISTVLTIGNIGYEIFSDKSYVNQITANVFDGYYKCLEL